MLLQHQRCWVFLATYKAVAAENKEKTLQFWLWEAWSPQHSEIWSPSGFQAAPSSRGHAGHRAKAQEVSHWTPATHNLQSCASPRSGLLFFHPCHAWVQNQARVAFFGAYVGDSGWNLHFSLPPHTPSKCSYYEAHHCFLLLELLTLGGHSLEHNPHLPYAHRALQMLHHFGVEGTGDWLKNLSILILSDQASSTSLLKSLRNCRFQQQEHFHGQFLETLCLGREMLTQTREEAHSEYSAFSTGFHPTGTARHSW